MASVGHQDRSTLQRERQKREGKLRIAMEDTSTASVARVKFALAQAV
jgi:hypothetical protein